MRNLSGIIARVAVVLVLNAGAPGTSSRVFAQEAARKLILTIVEGEGAINNVKARVAREPIVQVEDENNRPVAGALVTFTLPNSGPSGTFVNGSRMLTVTTDAKGQAAARGLRVNNSAGQMPIRVTATFQGLTATTTINQTIAGAAGAAAASTGGLFGLSLPATIAVVGAVAAGAAVGITLGVRSGNNPTRVSVGQPTLP